MRKIGAFILILGILAGVGGYMIQNRMSEDATFQKINAALTLLGMDAITPDTANKLLSSGVTVLDKTYTLKDLLAAVTDGEIVDICNKIQIYAFSPKLMWGGVGAAVLGLVIVITCGGRKRRR